MPYRDFDVLEEASFHRTLVSELDEYAIFRIDLNGTLATWNPGVKKILGYEQQEFVGHSYCSLFNEEDRAAQLPERELEGCRCAGRTRQRQWLRCKNGARAFVRGMTVRVTGGDGTLLGYTKVIHDITAQKAVEDSRKRLIARLGDMAYAFDLTHTMVRSLDGTIVRWTRGAERMYGWTAAEAEGRSSHVLMRTEFAQPLTEIESHLSQHGEWHGELTHVAKSGTRLYVASHWALRKTDAASAPLVIEVNNDMTETKRVQVELAQANHALSAFSYEVAHDLQSPLRSMAMCAQLLTATGEECLTTEQAELVRTISKNSERLRMLVQSLLQYASAQGNEDERQQISLQTVLDRALDNLATVIAESEAHVEAGTLPEVRAHASKVLQVLQNLISNAIKYHRTGVRPEIKVFADTTETGWTIHVQDNGMGIDQASLERVFTPLQRLHGAEISGTGLGLAICRRAVEAEGGRIWLDSTLGEGSTFHFTLCR